MTTVRLLLCGCFLLMGGSSEAQTDAHDTKRILKKEMTVSASPAQVWNAWTTNEGVKSFFAADANVELRIGGKYEIYFSTDEPKGKRGSEGCKVLSYLPHKMLSFQWSAPPKFPSLRSANAQTTVVLQFEELTTNSTKVTLSQFDWGEGDEWDQCYDYFDRAWSYVLNNLSTKLPERIASATALTSEKLEGTIYVAIVEKGPNWIAGNQPSDYPQFQQHVRIMREGLATGVVLAAGPMRDGAGGMSLLRADSLHQAKAFVNSDPFIQSEITVAKIYAWQPAVTKLGIIANGTTPSWPSTPDKPAKTWQDGEVKVTVNQAPEKMQVFEIVIPAALKTVWHALATTDGLRSLHGKHAFVDLRVGGTLSEWPGVEHKILSYLPYKMLSGVGSAPPQFPNVQKGGTWWVYEFDSVDDQHTKLRMSLLGWKDGEKEWDDAFNHFLKANPQYYNQIAKKLSG